MAFRALGVLSIVITLFTGCSSTAQTDQSSPLQPTSFEGAVEEYEGKSGAEDSWLLLEDITTSIQGSTADHPMMVRYSLGIRFKGSQQQQSEVITKWQQGNNLLILRGLADDVMKEYDLDRVRDESFKRTYSTELKKELNIQIADEVKKIMIIELRYG